VKGKMNSGTYVGWIEHLRGERALLKPIRGKDHRVLVQFNNACSLSAPDAYLDIGADLSTGWREFAASDFDIDIEMEWS